MSKNLKTNNREFAKLRKEKKVVEDLQRRGKNVIGAAGPGHKMTTSTKGTRARVYITTATPGARRREAKSRTLSRAFEAARR